MVMGWAGLLLFIGSWVRALGGGWGWLRWAGLGWARLVCGFVGSWVALGFVWVSFPRATSEGFSFSKLIAGVETRDPRRSADATAQATAEATAQATAEATAE